ncbi:MAG TPA: HD domain-containing protein [Tepidisphaeraceae bacterium]|jgi:putative hydrolase of HD superfamily
MDRLEQQIRFIVEIDRLKAICRRTMLIDRSRDENSAEHSWHIALMAPLLAEYADAKVDLLKVMKMLLVHDVVEIDAGDTYCYDASAHADKAQREQAGAKRIFGLLPSDQATEFRALWEEFEAAKTPEAKFANAMDRLQPLINNFHGEGASWKGNGITVQQVEKRMEPVGAAARSLGEYVRQVLEISLERGYLEPGK